MQMSAESINVAFAASRHEVGSKENEMIFPDSRIAAEDPKRDTMENIITKFRCRY